MNTPIYRGIADDLDMAGFDLLNGSERRGGDAAARKLDVKTYGAVGDGTTDDTCTVIQAALAAIPSAGGVLYFPAGPHKYHGATLTLDRPITVEGDGGGIERPVTLIPRWRFQRLVLTVQRCHCSPLPPTGAFRCLGFTIPA
jgi:hypothetical protein